MSLLGIQRLVFAGSNVTFLGCNRRLISFHQKKLAINMSSEMKDCLPFFACGKIIKGFGRGSKELGIPTANYPLEVVKHLPKCFQNGVYYGWANIDNGDVHKMVMSVGTNPFYDNKEKSMETHILHEFPGDLYDHILKVCIVGYLRPEKNFDSLDELITAIRNDIEQAKCLLDTTEESLKLKDSEFFKQVNSLGKDKIEQYCCTKNTE